jgi:hypothetical protein
MKLCCPAKTPAQMPHAAHRMPRHAIATAWTCSGQGQELQRLYGAGGGQDKGRQGIFSGRVGGQVSTPSTPQTSEPVARLCHNHFMPNKNTPTPAAIRLLKKAAAGHRLNSAQKRQVADLIEANFDSSEPDGSGYAQNANQLAALLGVSRQVIAYRRKLPDAPAPKLDGRLDVAEWREYMRRSSALDVGNVPRAETGPTEAQIFTEAREDALLDIGERLPDALAAAAELALANLDAGQRDAMVLVLWRAFAAVLEIQVSGEDTPAAITDAKRRLELIAAAE